MTAKTRRLRELLATGEFLYMPSAATPLEGRLAEAMGTSLVYTGGYASGTSRAVTEPLLTMDEQVRIAGEVARAVAVPLIADFVAKIRYACLQRDEADPDFVIIARSDTCREFGLDEAILRVNAAADVGADLGLVFPRNREEAEAAPRLASVPLIWVQSHGNRDGRPILPLSDLKAMGYRGCIDAQILLGAALHGMKAALREIMATGGYSGLSEAEFTALRKEIEDLIGLDTYYRIEAGTVEPATGETPR